MAVSLFLPSLLPLFPSFLSFKVSRQSEAACHRSFVYSDKIAAFIVCQINLKKKGSEEGMVKGREGGKKRRGKRGRKKKNNNTPITASSSLALACFYLSMTNSSVHSLLSSFLHVFSSPYLLSQHCITCHFRIMSPHVYNDIAFVLQITLGFSVLSPTPPAPTHMNAGIKIHSCTHTHRHTHKQAQVSKKICPENLERD